MYACKAASPAGVSGLLADHLYARFSMSTLLQNQLRGSRDSTVDDALPPVALSADKRNERLNRLAVLV